MGVHGGGPARGAGAWAPAEGADEVAATKQILGFDPAVSFPVEEAALARAREVGERARQLAMVNPRFTLLAGGGDEGGSG